MMSVGGGVSGSSGHSHPQHPHPFASRIQPSNPPPLHSPLQPYASPSALPLSGGQWPTPFPQLLFDSFSALSSLPPTFAPPSDPAAAGLPSSIRSLPLPSPFPSFPSYDAGVGAVPQQSLFFPSSLFSQAAADSAASSSLMSSLPLVAPSSFDSTQRTSIVQPRPINIALASSAPQQQRQQHLAMQPPSSFSSTSTHSASSPSFSLPQPLGPASSSFLASSVGPSPRPMCRRQPSNLVSKLTVHLMELFNGINDHYYAVKEKKRQEDREARRRERELREGDKAGGGGASRQQQTASQSSASTAATVPRAPSTPANAFDDRDSNYIVRQQEPLCDGRYIVEQSLGKGSFGRVIQCRDVKAGRSVAIKIIKSKRAFYKQAQVEVRILQSLQAECDRFNIVQMLDSFMHRGHMCIVFELLSINLYDLIRNTKLTGVTLILTAKFAYQILTTLAHLSSPARGNQRVIHCDLKPENILLRSKQRSMIKIIDFGSACRLDEKTYTYIQSRFYRAPEVLLGLPYNAAIDMWSLGCVLMELHTGHPLFDGADEKEQIVRHYEVLGCPPFEMVAGNSKAMEFFECEGGRRAVRLRDTQTARKVSSVRHALGDKFVANDQRSKQFVDLVEKMLTYSPKLRIKPYDALSHPFFDILQQHSHNGAKATADRSSFSSVEASPVSGPVAVPVSLQPSVDVRIDLSAAQPSPIAAASSEPAVHSEDADDVMMDDKENDVVPISVADAPPLERTQSDLHTRPFVHAPLPRSTSQDELDPCPQTSAPPTVTTSAAQTPLLPAREKRKERERSIVNSSRNARAALVMSLRSRTKKAATSTVPAVPIFNPFTALQSSPSQPSHEDASSNDSMNDDTGSPHPPSSAVRAKQPAAPPSLSTRRFTRSQHHRSTSFDGADSQNELHHLVMTDDGGSDNSPHTASSAACVRRRGSGSLKGRKTGSKGKQGGSGRRTGGGSKSASHSRPGSPVQQMVVELSARRRTRRPKQTRVEAATTADESGYRTPSPARAVVQQSPPTATGMQTRSHKAAQVPSTIVAMDDDTQPQPQPQPLIATRSQTVKTKPSRQRRAALQSTDPNSAIHVTSSHSTRRHPHTRAHQSASAFHSSPRPSHFSNLPPASSNGTASVRRPVTRSSATATVQQHEQQQVQQHSSQTFDHSLTAPALNAVNAATMMDTVDSISKRTRSHAPLR